MATRSAVITAVAILPALAWARAPGDPPAHWTHRKAIELPAPVGPGFVEALLDAEVYAQATPALTDLRIRDAEGADVAYVLRRHETARLRSERDVPLRDVQVTTWNERRFVIDLGAQPGVHDRIRIRVGRTARNFRVPVTVETSTDGETWQLVRLAGFIYVVEGETRAADTSVSYPRSTARYVRLTIAPWQGYPLPVAGAAVVTETAAHREEASVEATRLETTQDAEARTTRLVLDLGSRHPVDRADLDIADKRFHRVVLIEASADRREWLLVGSGAVSAIEMPGVRDRHTTLHFPETATRYLRLTIQNLDDHPLQVSGVRLAAVRRGLVFQATPGQRYHLDYGHAAVAAPRYDLARAFPYLESETLPVATLGPARRLPPPAPRAWTEGRPILLWAVMLVAVLALGGLLLRLARHIGPAQAPPNAG